MGANTSQFANLTSNTRLPRLLGLFDRISRINDPRQIQVVFVDTMRELYGSKGFMSVRTDGCDPGEYRIDRLLAADSGPQPLPDDFREGDKPRCFRGGFIGDVIADGLPKLIRRLYVPDDVVLGNQLARYRSLIAAPLFLHGQTNDWVFIFDTQSDFFNETNLEDLLLRANLIGVMAQNLSVTQQLRDANARIHAEMDRIARIQRALLPDSLPTVPGLLMASSYQTYDRAGGDMYDIAPLVHEQSSGSFDPNGRWALLIADVSGHGPSAAVVMAMVHAILHAYPHEPRGPAEVLTHLNHHLYAKRIEATFVTAFLAFYNPQDRSFSYARAGHNPPLIKPKGYGKTLRPLDAVGHLPLGIMDAVEYDEAKLTLAPGETLVLYTDGIIEAEGPNGAMFGIRGLEHALTNCAGDPDCVIASVNTVLREHEAGMQQKDDQTMLAIQVREEATS